MASSEFQSVQVDAELSFSPPTHSFSSAYPPTLTLKLISHAKHPITFFTWNTPLSLKNSLTSKGFIITDTATSKSVEQSLMHANRAPLTRTRNSSDEQYFLTLEPEEPVELSIGFGRAGGGAKPQPKAVVERGWEVDDEGKERRVRRSMNATGVDGLEPGHEYIIGLNEEALKRIWWAPVKKEDILVDAGSEGSYVQDYPWERARPVDFKIKEATLAVSE